MEHLELFEYQVRINMLYSRIHTYLEELQLKENKPDVDKQRVVSSCYNACRDLTYTLSELSILLMK